MLTYLLTLIGLGVLVSLVLFGLIPAAIRLLVNLALVPAAFMLMQTEFVMRYIVLSDKETLAFAIAFAALFQLIRLANPRPMNVIYGPLNEWNADSYMKSGKKIDLPGFKNRPRLLSEDDLAKMTPQERTAYYASRAPEPVTNGPSRTDIGSSNGPAGGGGMT